MGTKFRIHRFVNNQTSICVDGATVHVMQTRQKGKRQQHHFVTMSVHEFAQLVELANGDIQSQAEESSA